NRLHPARLRAALTCRSWRKCASRRSPQLMGLHWANPDAIKPVIERRRMMVAKLEYWISRFATMIRVFGAVFRGASSAFFLSAARRTVAIESLSRQQSVSCEPTVRGNEYLAVGDQRGRPFRRVVKSVPSSRRLTTVVQLDGKIGGVKHMQHARRGRAASSRINANSF